MDTEKIAGELKEIIDIDLESKGYTEFPSVEAIKIILDTLQPLNYKIIQPQALQDSYKLMDAQTVFEQWITVEDDSIEIHIPATQVLQHLISLGWIIIPPV